MILTMIPILQKDYGEDYDCTITSITTVIYSYSQRNAVVADIYNAVESIANKYGYNGKKYGTNPLTIKHIFDRSILNILNKRVSSKCAYLKGAGFNFASIKRIIDSGNPVILSTNKFGKYKNHTVTIIGYDGDNLVIYDNWTRVKTYIEYKQLSVISSINWVEMKG